MEEKKKSARDIEEPEDIPKRNEPYKRNNKNNNNQNIQDGEEVKINSKNTNIVENNAQKDIFGSININKEKVSKTTPEVKEINVSIIEKADNISHNFKLSKEIEKENSNPNIIDSILNKRNINIDSKSDNNSKKSGFSNQNKLKIESSNKNFGKSKEESEEFSADKCFKNKNRNIETKSSLEAKEVVEDPEYLKEMKELNRLFKKNLLKIKFEKFPNNETCNKKHLNMSFPERDIFNNLIKQNIPEEEWYDFIYEEILNYNCLKN